ncbi:MAG: hypothetical protein M1818_006185 [Claussenomyces sp. TS43310]|nr:MAG: hypothetical protein M1818_006185 [Claussenomyces sp. TS43310]
MGGYSEEFPLLAAYSLYPAEIRGDGNCLFNALSDQIYGHQNEHQKIRARVIEYMREHAEYYKQFIDVYPGGGQRRNPKRKNAGVYSKPVDVKPPTPAEIDRVFEAHLSSMARGGTYGDNMEISAFTSAFGIDVKIYQADFAYMIPAPDTGSKKQVAHLAYHTWEHYSSIRNIDGPHTGLPCIIEKSLSPQEEARNDAAAAKVSRVLPWQINVVLSSLPYLADRETIKKTLEEYKGNINDAVSALMDAEERASVSSQQGSSSTERDLESDDDELAGPSKKQDRRMSRATKAAQKERAERERKAAISSQGPTSVAKMEPTPVTPLSPSVQLPVRSLKLLAPKPVSQILAKEDEGEWTTPSDDDDDADFTPDPAEADEDAGSEYSGRSQSRLPAIPSRTSAPSIKITINPGKSHQRQQGPRKKGPTARERMEQKKAAQKAARKESKRRDAQASKQLAPASVNVKSNVPSHDLGMGIKTLYI